MDLSRRELLRAGLAGTALAAGGLWLDPRLASASARRSAPLLIVAFLRGGADGLHLVPPVADPSYPSLRGSLALEQTLKFTRDFGLHPAFEPAAGLIERGALAAVHAAGSPHPTRSHFEAQDLMEAGELSLRSERGWLARALGEQPEPFAAVALSGELPLSLRGSGAFAMHDPAHFGLGQVSRVGRAALERLYAAGSDDPLREAGSEALAALARLEQRLPSPRTRSASRARLRAGLAESARHVVTLEATGLPLRAVAIESSGWDTHTGQGAEQGAMARSIDDLARALDELDRGLTGRRDWLLVAHTEFGRTVRPNGSRGSDHGHGSVMLLAGSRVRAGVYGAWRGLDSGLYEGRDLHVLNDYRQVLREVLEVHLGLDARAVFADLEPAPRLGLLQG